MSSIPASEIVKVIPGVLAAGGNALELNGLFLTTSTRVPIGVVEDLGDEPSVAGFFGGGTPEDVASAIYFLGFDDSTQKPGSMRFAQYNQAAVSAWLRGGRVDTLTLAQLKALSGSLTVSMDGYSFTNAAFNLNAASSFTAAGALIKTALNAALPAGASFTGTIAAGTATTATASISGNIMTVTAILGGNIKQGAVLTGAGVTSGTVVDNQLTGLDVPGGVGEYAVSKSQTVVSTTITASYGLLAVSAVGSGTLSPGQTITGGTTAGGTIITAYDTGQGLTGNYIVNLSQTVAAPTTATATALDVSFDSISGAFVITSGVTGAESLAGFATGTLAASLKLTLATGAVNSQGSDVLTPSNFMNGVIDVDQNWASFMTLFDPDGGVGFTQKLAFATWVNSTLDRYAYMGWDNDQSVIAAAPALSSFGYALQQGNYSGTCPVYQLAGGSYDKAVFLMGAIASVDFSAVNGRTTFKFRSQTGLVADVTKTTAYRNLVKNGYNSYAVFATANQKFTFNTDGVISGPFKWLDSYINQIWLNNQFQLAFMLLLVAMKSIPYNADGYALIEAAGMDPINQGLRFGAFRAGVTMSQLQIAEVNTAAGKKISDVLQQRGWYLQILDADPQVRQARGTPPCNFWYMDGESVHKITLNSVNVQ